MTGSNHKSLVGPGSQVDNNHMFQTKFRINPLNCGLTYKSSVFAYWASYKYLASSSISSSSSSCCCCCCCSSSNIIETKIKTFTICQREKKRSGMSTHKIKTDDGMLFLQRRRTFRMEKSHDQGEQLFTKT